LVRNSSVGSELCKDEAISLPAKPGVLKYGELLVSERGVEQTLFIQASGKPNLISPSEGNESLVHTMKEGGMCRTRICRLHAAQSFPASDWYAMVLTLTQDAFESLDRYSRT
jgi:hypothetical protein